MEKHLNFILQFFSVLLYWLILHVEIIFVYPYKGTDAFVPWFIVFFILDWIYVDKMSDLLKEKTPKHL